MTIKHIIIPIKNKIILFLNLKMDTILEDIKLIPKAITIETRIISTISVLLLRNLFLICTPDLLIETILYCHHIY